MDLLDNPVIDPFGHGDLRQMPEKDEIAHHDFHIPLGFALQLLPLDLDVLEGGADWLLDVNPGLGTSDPFPVLLEPLLLPLAVKEVAPS